MSESPLGNLLNLNDVQGWLALDGTENTYWISAAVDAASDAVLDWLQWDPRSQTVTDLYDGTGGNSLPVLGYPITAVSAISYLYPGCAPQADPMTSISWSPKDPMIYNGCGFPYGTDNVQVTFTRGFATLPNSILQGVRYTIKSMIDGSGVDFNATGESYPGVIAQTWQPGGPATVPVAAQTLMRRFQRKFIS